MPQQQHTAHAGHALAGLWAIDPRVSLREVFLQLNDAPLALRAQDNEDRFYLRMLRETGGFTRFVNPDGTEVSSLDQDASQRILPGAIAVVPIHGVMMRSCPDWYQYYGITSTARATRDVADAIANPNVARIIMSVYSPGGMVYGTEQLSETIRTSTKPVDTHVSDLAASAAVFATCHSKSIQLAGRSTEMGSIGTMATVINDEAYWNDLGIRWVEVYASASTEKNAAYNEAAEGNTTKYVAYLDRHNANFLAAVQSGRPKVAPEALTGAMFIGQQAVEVGLADGYATLDEVIALAAQQVAADDRVPDPNRPQQQQQQPQVMSLMQKLAAFTAAIANVFAKKEEPTAEELTNANNALKAEGISGVQLVPSAQVEALAQAAELRQQLEAAQASVVTLTQERDAAKASLATATEQANTQNQAVEAFATEHNLQAAEGKSLLETVLANAKEWGARTPEQHSGKGKAGDAGKEKKYSSVAAFEKEAK